ncbi:MULTISPECIES: TetR/AcrR family transcriptional regulator [Sphingobium]|uniref:TetR/AcrR family transcriptional regulator n=1 Tax=Sphingobium sp. MI1205 TaxID=407020 RepID=UPI000770223F|nr:TetR/AcrR family transcriptional regulator [Sphingobium sp. MI1205]AMK19836.1 TetR family transcriptional regulator [Sphingobium sp. MI1205]
MSSSPSTPRARGRPRRNAADTNSQTGAERLLAVALEAFATQGFEGAGVRHIAAQAGVDPALIKHQFGSKADLWRAAVDTLADQLLSALAPARAIVSEGADRAVIDAVSHLVDVTCDNPQIAKFVLSELVRQNEQSDYVFQKLVKPIHDLLAPLIASACCTGEDAPDPDLLFFAFNGAIVTAIAGRPFIERMSQAAGSNIYFREQLKRTVVAQLLPAAVRGNANGL